MIELGLAFQGEAQVVVRRGVVRFGRDHFGVAGGRLTPLLLFETQMAKAGVNFGGFFPAGCRAFQFLYGVVQPARRGELHRVPQGAGLGGAQRLRFGGGGIAPHQPFYQFVVYKESLFVIQRKNAS